MSRKNETILEDLVFVWFNELKGKGTGTPSLAYQRGTSSQTAAYTKLAVDGAAASQSTTTGVHT